jgi:hypothetical protein
MKSYKRDLPQNTQEPALPALFDPETRFLTISPTQNPTKTQPKPNHRSTTLDMTTPTTLEIHDNYF